MYYLPSVLSGVAVALLWRWLFSGEFGLINAMLSYIKIDGPSWLGDRDWALRSLVIMSLWGIGSGAIIYLAGLQGIPTDLELFASGKVAVLLTNPSGVNRFRTIERFEWDVGTLPLGNADRRGTGGGGTGWASFAGTVSPEYSWQFIKHITSEQAEYDEVAVGATTPARTAVANSEAFLDPNNPPANSHIFAQAQEYVVRDPVHLHWPEIRNRVYKPNLDLLWRGDEDAATVAQLIKEESDPLFAPDS